jgi:hypothetical protein
VSSNYRKKVQEHHPGRENPFPEPSDLLAARACILVEHGFAVSRAGFDLENLGSGRAPTGMKGAFRGFASRRKARSGRKNPTFVR